VLVGLSYRSAGQGQVASELARHTLLDFAELFLFLAAGMTFVNTLQEWDCSTHCGPGLGE
jgi:hypothetical protein